MNLLGLLAPLAYVAAVQLAVKYSIKPLTGALVAVVLPFVVNSVFRWIQAVGFDLPILGYVLSIPIIVTLVCQLAVAYLVFAKLELTDGLAAWLGWVVGGGLIILALPAVITTLLR